MIVSPRKLTSFILYPEIPNSIIVLQYVQITYRHYSDYLQERRLDAFDQLWGRFTFGVVKACSFYQAEWVGIDRTLKRLQKSIFIVKLKQFKHLLNSGNSILAAWQTCQSVLLWLYMFAFVHGIKHYTENRHDVKMCHLALVFFFLISYDSMLPIGIESQITSRKTHKPFKGTLGQGEFVHNKDDDWPSWYKCIVSTKWILA